jgi:hypothetical protein
MKYKPFAHAEVDAGYKTPCHRPALKLDRDGYAVVPSRTTALRAHRVRWVEAGNERAPILDHLCRNRWCCNPAHLEPVTSAENVRRGLCTKIDDSEVALIKVLYAEGNMTQAAIGREFGVSQGHVSHLVNDMYRCDGPCKHWEMRKEAARV